jgi:hypothetical protein
VPWFDGGVEKTMSSLDILNQRLNYQGGNAEQRFIKEKEKSLKKALLYSYQAETLVTLDGKEFRCLINSDKLKNEYDDKILSIPYDDILLNSSIKGKTSKNLQNTIVKPGDVFKWKETNTYWIIYLHHLEENAYFRAKIRKCNNTVQINNNEYHVYVRGPVETAIQWYQKNNIEYNSLNYSKVMYITKNEETEAYLHRFSKIELSGKPWEVQVVNSVDADGIIEVMLDEDYQNSIEKAQKEKAEASNKEPVILDTDAIYIAGPAQVSSYSTVAYTIENGSDLNGSWSISNKRAKIVEHTNNTIKIEIIAGKKGSFTLEYKDNNNIYSKEINIIPW